jgi:hypothetical protein
VDQMLNLAFGLNGHPNGNFYSKMSILTTLLVCLCVELNFVFVGCWFVYMCILCIAWYFAWL